MKKKFNRLNAGLFKSVEEVDQARDIQEVLGVLGLIKYLGKRKLNRGDYPIYFRNPALRKPLEVSSALCDILNLKEIIIDGAYSLDEKLENKVRGLPIIDIGAFIGISTAYFGSRFPTSKILAIEPQTRNYQKLVGNAFGYGDQIHPIKAALQAHFGGSEIVNSPNRHPFMPLFVPDGNRPLNEEGVAVNITPDTIVNSGFFEGSKIGILKVDIEGAEKEIFGSNAINNLLSKTQILMIETHDQFVAGCSEAVDQATSQCGLKLIDQNPHSISIYSRI